MKDKPESKKKLLPSLYESHERVWLRSFDDYLDSHLTNSKLKVVDMALAMYLSERTLRERLKDYTGLRPKEYLQKRRVQLARELIDSGNYDTLVKVVTATGFRSVNQLTEAYCAQYGVMPSL
jgi:transcriptional regulator GlxA family with amidase domain